MGTVGADLFDVVLIDSGENVIRVIKEIRRIVDMGLKEAKDLADQTPSVIAAAVPATTAEAARRLLEELGALVELRPAGSGSSSGRLTGGSAEALEMLVDRGALSEGEQVDAASVLSEAPPGEYRKMVRMLTELFDLHKEGVLSASEFQAKKWDVLSRKWW